MTAPVDEDLTVLDQLSDLAPPCEYRPHEVVGSGPAVWVVHFRIPMTCGCAHRNSVILFCDSCWTWRNHLGLTRCHICRTVTRCMADVLRVERI